MTMTEVKKNMFDNARQIFIKNCRDTVNFQAGFKCRFHALAGREYELRITGATLYSIYLNGIFIFYGPARAPHGYLRVDTVKLYPTEGENTLCVNLAGYNCPSFATMAHPSFLQAEIFENGTSIRHTGRDFSAISLNKLREPKTYRYSYQRAFTEVWYLDNSSALTNWMETDFESEPVCAHVYDEVLIPRIFEHPDFCIADFGSPIAYGAFEPAAKPVVYDSAHLTGKDTSMVCYPGSEVRHHVLTDVQGKYTPDSNRDLTENRYALFDFGRVNTGFIRVNITAHKDSEVYVIFSEDITKDAGLKLGDLPGIITYELKASDRPYDLEAFEAYSLRYMTVLVKHGEIQISCAGLREYSYPLSHNTSLEIGDEKLLRIFDAARETFRQNTIDCFMDCPGRERGGWLCDSYFTGQAEQIFAGHGTVEEQFLKNFMLAKEFPGLPAGLLPDNYPGENLQVIPQWIMWYILEVNAYLKRRRDDKEIFREYCYVFLEYLEQFRREDGLLKKLDGWNFIEWSEANRYVEMADVSYPTNMLYALVLETVGNLYEDDRLLHSAELMKKQIALCSFTGTLFCDGARWNGTEYVNMTEISEACQFYAVFCGIAEEQDKRYARFYEYFYNILGYRRKLKKEYPEIAYSNLFIGMTIRFECLLKSGRYEQLLEEVKEYYWHMSDETGTLWEHDSKSASLNHGLSSAAGAFIIKGITGIIGIDEAAQVITLDERTPKTAGYKVSIGLEQGCLYVDSDGMNRGVKVDGPYLLQYVNK